MSSAVPVCARRLYTTEPLATPGAGAADPKIAAIVDQIEGLTLLQTSELVSQLKVNLAFVLLMERDIDPIYYNRLV